MVFLSGQGALPAFRRRRIEEELSRLADQPVAVHSSWFYLLEADGLPEGRAGRRLLRLLDASPWEAPPQGSLFIVPRRGTQSPWSSKATDILARCGFGNIGRIERGQVIGLSGLTGPASTAILEQIHDRMTQSVTSTVGDLNDWFLAVPPGPLETIELGEDPAAAMAVANRTMGLALSDGEVAYLVEAYSQLERNPTDAELMMFAQANSEHCRHKIFNASWTVDGQAMDETLFGMIRNTHAATPSGVLSAYHDNAAVMEGYPATYLNPSSPGAETGEIYGLAEAPVHVQIKVETHNHPTAISPFPGAATGSGGEIRDESATGRGARPVAGLTGFSVSDLKIPGLLRSWETGPDAPSRQASAFRIMQEGPIGAASFNNEFGRPALGGYFRTLSMTTGERLYGYCKPIMIAGGSGTILESQVEKKSLRDGDKVIVLGGPAMLIGLGGGAASSMASGTSTEELDFASVQRGNPEMQRRCQEVIDRCWARGQDNPIRSIHDVGAGGLSNAVPELLDDGGVGGSLELREIPTADPGLSPMELWSNEAQERYVLAIAADDLAEFRRLCQRERCPFAVLGTATEQGRLRLDDRLTGTPAVDMELDLLLGKPPRMHRDVTTAAIDSEPEELRQRDPAGLARDVLGVPSVGSKQFLITIGDRTVGGMSVRDQMVGPWQVPVADCAVTVLDYESYHGSAMAMGERTPLAIWNAPASGRMAVGEALTNLAGTRVEGLQRIKLSANWMAAAGAEGQDADLYRTVHAVGMEFCPALGLAIPVGKDSLSMQTVWNDETGEHRMIAPVSLIVSAFAPVPDVRRNLTPQLVTDSGSTRLLLVDLGTGRMRLGGSAAAQAASMAGGEVPDVEDPGVLKAFFETMQELIDDQLLLAYHDRSDGGLFTTLCEMAFAGHTGLELQVDVSAEKRVEFLFNEELGGVIQVADENLATVRARFEAAGLGEFVTDLGRPVAENRIRFGQPEDWWFDEAVTDLEQIWSETSHAMQRHRDHPECADEEFARLADWNRRGLEPVLSFDPGGVEPGTGPEAPYVANGARPRVAILREQGVNGQREMAFAFMQAGFEAVDVHMSDLEAGRYSLEEFRGLAVCGGFSFGDVLGAGQGWARSILFNDRLRAMFTEYFADTDRFALGVCNGCQMLSALREIIPGTEGWPRFVRNRSRQFEARLSLVAIEETRSVFLSAMAGSRLPVSSAHGEGRADFADRELPGSLVAMRYVNSDGSPAEGYPVNPNGSPGGITGLCNEDGRVTIMMPHPERLLRTVNFSWAPPEWGERSPWMYMFDQARAWVG